MGGRGSGRGGGSSKNPWSVEFASADEMMASPLYKTLDGNIRDARDRITAAREEKRVAEDRFNQAVADEYSRMLSNNPSGTYDTLGRRARTEIIRKQPRLSAAIDTADQKIAAAQTSLLNAQTELDRFTTAAWDSFQARIK